MPAPNDPTLDFYNSERLKEWSNKMAVKEESCSNEVNAGARPPMSNQERPCEACERGERLIKPPRSSIVGSLAVHAPSGMVCVRQMTEQQWELHQRVFGAKK